MFIYSFTGSQTKDMANRSPRYIYIPMILPQLTRKPFKERTFYFYDDTLVNIHCVVCFGHYVHMVWGLGTICVCFGTGQYTGG